jgi:hypothetical protein
MLLFHVLGDDVMDLSVFVVLSQCSQPRDLSRYVLSVTNHPHGHFGPLLGRLLLLLLDNLVAAQRKKDGDQPVLELLRQLCECAEWFNPCTHEFVSIADKTVYNVTFDTACAAL